MRASHLERTLENERRRSARLEAERDRAIKEARAAVPLINRQRERAERAEDERDRLREALERARHWHEQLDYDEALNVIDAALGPGSEGE